MSLNVSERDRCTYYLTKPSCYFPVIFSSPSRKKEWVNTMQPWKQENINNWYGGYLRDNAVSHKGKLICQQLININCAVVFYFLNSYLWFFCILVTSVVPYCHKNQFILLWFHCFRCIKLLHLKYNINKFIFITAPLRVFLQNEYRICFHLAYSSSEITRWHEGHFGFVGHLLF